MVSLDEGLGKPDHELESADANGGDKPPFQEPQDEGDMEFDQPADDFYDTHFDLSDIVRVQGQLSTGGKVFNPAMSDAA